MTLPPTSAGRTADVCRADRRRQMAGGSRLCAHCLCTPRAMPSHHYIPLRCQILYVSPSIIRYPFVTVNVKCPPLDDFQPRSGGWDWARCRYGAVAAAASPACAGVHRCVRSSHTRWSAARRDEWLLPLARYAHSCRPVRLAPLMLELIRPPVWARCTLIAIAILCSCTIWSSEAH